MSLRTEIDVLEFIRPRVTRHVLRYPNEDLTVRTVEYEYDPDAEWVDYKEAEDEFTKHFIENGPYMMNQKYKERLIEKINRFKETGDNP